MIKTRFHNMSLHELIDTQWDVNLLGASIVVAYGVELIDTQWDVNALGYLNWFFPVKELIDTQWDVNANKSKRHMYISLN